MKKRLIAFVLMFLLVGPIFVLAADETTSCTGFWGSISCFLWGSRGNLVG
ncbi:MAG: hypothetical protein AABX04_04075 [Nanoarchaeota archaeon]